MNVDEARRSEVLSITDIFRCKVVDISPHYYTIEVTGDEDKIKAIIDLFRPLGIKEIARTGQSRAAARKQRTKRHKRKSRAYIYEAAICTKRRGRRPARA